MLHKIITWIDSKLKTAMDTARPIHWDQAHYYLSRGGWEKVLGCAITLKTLGKGGLSKELMDETIDVLHTYATEMDEHLSWLKGDNAPCPHQYVWNTSNKSRHFTGGPASKYQMLLHWAEQYGGMEAVESICEDARKEAEKCLTS